jgi:hypothetical protein
MTLSQGHSQQGLSIFALVKSILIWTFALTVCMVVIGFPMLLVVVALASLMAVALHAIMPVGAVLLIAVGFIGIHAVGILLASAYLTLRGIHPQDVDWLRWLHGQENPGNEAIYAACPLTCGIEN